MHTRLLRSALTAALLLLSVTAVTAIAGGGAVIVPDDSNPPEPRAGEDIEYGFTVLQHGETPAGWETATVHFTNVSTGQTIDVAATNDRPDGHFVATTTLPEAGYWSWHVTLQDLESDHLPIGLTIATASGQVPAYDPSTTVTAIAKAKQDVTETLRAQFFVEIERLDNLLRVEQAKTDRLVTDVNAITSERDALATRVAAAEGTGGLPILAILTLAVLAGASAGFAMAWLAGRPGPTVKVSPTPQGVDPA